MTIYSLDILLFLFGTSLLFHVPFQLFLPDLHRDFSRGRSGGLVFPSLSEFSTIYCDPLILMCPKYSFVPLKSSQFINMFVGMLCPIKTTPEMECCFNDWICLMKNFLELFSIFSHSIYNVCFYSYTIMYSWNSFVYFPYLDFIFNCFKCLFLFNFSCICQDTENCLFLKFTTIYFCCTHF